MGSKRSWAGSRDAFESRPPPPPRCHACGPHQRRRPSMLRLSRIGGIGKTFKAHRSPQAARLALCSSPAPTNCGIEGFVGFEPCHCSVTILGFVVMGHKHPISTGVYSRISEIVLWFLRFEAEASATPQRENPVRSHCSKQASCSFHI